MSVLTILFFNHSLIHKFGSKVNCQCDHIPFNFGREQKSNSVSVCAQYIQGHPEVVIFNPTMHQTMTGVANCKGVENYTNKCISFCKNIFGKKWVGKCIFHPSVQLAAKGWKMIPKNAFLMIHWQLAANGWKMIPKNVFLMIHWQPAAKGK